MSSLVTPAYEEHRTISLMMPSPRRRALGNILTEGILYFEKSYAKADEVSKSLLTDDDVDRRWQAEIIRASVINSGYLGDEVALQRKERRLRKIFNEADSPLDQVFLLEGLARAQAQLGKLRAIDELQEAWEIVEAGQQAGVFSSLRYVQVVRAHLRINEQLSDRNDLALERRAEDALLVCRQFGYGRYEEEISGSPQLTGTCS
jgi:hypothetical protein